MICHLGSQLEPEHVQVADEPGLQYVSTSSSVAPDGMTKGLASGLGGCFGPALTTLIIMRLDALSVPFAFLSFLAIRKLWCSLSCPSCMLTLSL